MGYRSNVAMLITTDDGSQRKIEELMIHLKLSQISLRDWTDPKVNHPYVGWNHHTFAFRADDVKWYPEYPEVQAIERVWDIAQKVHGLSGVYLRVGENPDDTKEIVFGEDPPWQEAFISRQIVLHDDLPFGEFGDEVPHMQEEEKTNE
jgi:hypothetical protein